MILFIFLFNFTICCFPTTTERLLHYCSAGREVVLNACEQGFYFLTKVFQFSYGMKIV